jgi:hypothetical protein
MDRKQQTFIPKVEGAEMDLARKTFNSRSLAKT